MGEGMGNIRGMSKDRVLVWSLTRAKYGVSGAEPLTRTTRFYWYLGAGPGDRAWSKGPGPTAGEAGPGPPFKEATLWDCNAVQSQQCSVVQCSPGIAGAAVERKR
jgi:hypothetical protein